MSFLTPDPLATGPVNPYEVTSFKFTAPTPTRRDFQIRFVASTVKISVRDLKQSRANNATSKKNW
jgi:hypothetical protein